MRVHRPGTDQNLELTITINGVAATEYELPNASLNASSDGYLDTYIAVRPSDRLGLKWTWSGSLLHGQFDFVADGTFVRENRIEGDSQTGAVKFIKKTQRFDTGLDCPTPEGWTSSEPNKDLFEGNLVVMDLDEESLVETAGGSRPGVGSLVFVASINQHTLDQYHDQEKSLEMGSWKRRVGDEVRVAEIPPEFALELRLSSDDKIKPKRSVQHRNRWGQTRFGLKAWGKMCFYYRSETAIEQADGVARDDKTILEVEAWDDERDFMAVEPVKRTAARRKGGAASGDEDGDESLFVSTKGTPERKIKQENGSDQGVTPEPKKKKAKLGGALFGSAEKVQHQDNDAANDEVESGYQDEGFDSQDNVEPSSSELAAAPDDDPFQQNSSDSAKNLDDFDQQASEVPASASIHNTTLSPPNWNFPSSPPPRQQKLIEESPPSPTANAAMDPSIDSPTTKSSTLPASFVAATATTSINRTDLGPDTEVDPNMDTFHIPTSIEIENELDATGTPRAQVEQLLKNNGPFADPSAAEAIFAQRVAFVAVVGSDGKLYRKSTEEGAVSAGGRKTVKPRSRATAKKASPAPRAAAKKRSPAFSKSESTPAIKRTAAANNTVKTQHDASSAPTRDGARYTARQDVKPESSSRHVTRQQTPAAAAAQKCKLPPPAVPATPAPLSKRSRTESSTPCAGSGLKARKHYKANLRRELAAKEARLEKAGERVKREEEQIAELERLNREADEQLREMEDDDDDDDDDDDGGDENMDIEDEDGDEDGDENGMEED